MTRLSLVGTVKIRTILFSAIFQAGDNLVIAPSSSVFAVQREVPTYLGNEGNFNDPLFTAPIPRPIQDEQVQVSIRNVKPLIQVGSLDIIGVSTASVVQIGSNRLIQAESRMKHIRQLLPRPRRADSEARA
ncbi:spore gernimation protein [Paenibacillus darwinianus]|uniref:Spore gernimation protein n=1 Tax=Paenibacillus darwinianus TaxID=1380763 RepID=A0A9W5W687_9BACL|nr:spore germination protein GerPE [Paenibacillus darwinianus]EXX85775.1 spore gernimation protein [Paenibacillus darwinianus]EXX85954.1 spore gernimation protein [Paenibacillus darwinianus]EXX88662.1 spore gernimation protein [Paenibacillus darwinianus]